MNLTGLTFQQQSRFAGPRRIDAREVHTIGIVVFDGFSLLQAAEIADVFDKANRICADRHDCHAQYRTVFVSHYGGRVSSASHIDVLTQALPEAGFARALFVVANDPKAGSMQDLQSASWLREVSASELTFCHPAREGGSAESTTAAALNHALGVIHRDLGPQVVQAVMALTPGDRSYDLVALAVDNVSSVKQKIRESARWISNNCHKSISITVAAQTAGMSERSFLRHFRAEMGIKPSEHLRRARVDMAAAMLKTSDLPVDKIARRCGLMGGECLARLFRQLLQVSPTEYRNRFQSGLA